MTLNYHRPEVIHYTRNRSLVINCCGDRLDDDGLTLIVVGQQSIRWQLSFSAADELIGKESAH